MEKEGPLNCCDASLRSELQNIILVLGANSFVEVSGSYTQQG